MILMKVMANRTHSLIQQLNKKFKIETFDNSINVSEKKSDLRIQIQTDIRYQNFLGRAKAIWGERPAGEPLSVLVSQARG